MIIISAMGDRTYLLVPNMRLLVQISPARLPVLAQFHEWHE